MTLACNPTESEDLVQETCLRAIRAKERLRPESNIKGWLFTILRNIWWNQMRSAQNSHRVYEFDESKINPRGGAAHPSTDPLDNYLEKQKRGDIQNAINNLPTLYREIVLLRDIEGLNYRQIAEVLCCPDGTVMSRLGRAREKLRLALLHWAPQREMSDSANTRGTKCGHSSFASVAITK